MIVRNALVEGCCHHLAAFTAVAHVVPQQALLLGCSMSTDGRLLRDAVLHNSRSRRNKELLWHFNEAAPFHNPSIKQLRLAIDALQLNGAD